mgnify:CR=1 FL=1
MKRLRDKRAVRVLAVLLLTALAVVLAASAYGALYLYQSDVYTAGTSYKLVDQTMWALLGRRAHEVWDLYTDYREGYTVDLDRYLSPAWTNAMVTIKGPYGSTQYSTYSTLEEDEYWMEYEDQYNRWNNIQNREQTYTVTLYLRTRLTARDQFYYASQWLDRLYRARYGLLWVLGIGAALYLGLMGFVLSGAGRRPGSEDIHLTWLDRVPLDLLVAIGGFLGLGLLVLGMDYGPNVYRALAPGLVCLALAAGGLSLVGTALLMSLAVRVKAGGWWRNTLIYRIRWLLLTGFRALFRFLRLSLRMMHLYWKLGLAWAALCLTELFLLAACDCDEAVLVLWFLEKLALSVALVLVAMNLHRLQQGGRRLAAGDLDTQVDLRHMFLDFREHGENLNSIGAGMLRAVEARMKSERLKTELITNVSHDIKTPLTSIVNYVDLLKKLPVEPQEARGYLEVLDRQSQRLKKLTEDLVEASKAATGNVTVNLEPTDVNVLLCQAAGEYQDKLAALRLELVLNTCQPDPWILADGKLLWRVFDNLLGNICKYAMPGTRVYLTTWADGKTVSLLFRNISNDPLNVSADELMERFVRGDASRTTEGSGLGLSIARSLVTLQGGAFNLTTDGDLFKVEISFPQQVGGMGQDQRGDSD